MSETSAPGILKGQLRNVKVESFPQHQQGEVAERLKATVC